MAVLAYPVNLKIYLDGEDITFYLIGADTFTPTETRHIFRDMDLSSYIGEAGIHEIKVTTEGGTGRVDCRVEIA